MKCHAGVVFPDGKPCPKCNAKLGEVCWPGINADLLAVKSLREENEKLRAELARSSERIDVAKILEDNCWALRCIDIPTGAGDADIGWNVVEHHMAPPKERIVGTGNSPIEAIRDAVSRSTEGGK